MKVKQGRDYDNSLENFRVCTKFTFPEDETRACYVHYLLYFVPKSLKNPFLYMWHIWQQDINFYLEKH